MTKPSWTVLYNIVSPERGDYVGTGWEFFTLETDAQKCFDRHVKAGNCPTKRPYESFVDFHHLGAAHKWGHRDTSLMTLIYHRQTFEYQLRRINEALLFIKRDKESGEYTNAAHQNAWSGWKMAVGIYDKDNKDQDKADICMIKEI